MTIKILGAGTPDSITLEENLHYALRQLNKSAEIEKISNIRKIIHYHARSIPALVVNERIVGYGSMLPEGIKKILKKIR